MLRGVTVWTPILGLLGLLAALFSDAIKTWVRRLLRLEHEKSAPPGAPSVTTTP
jgi:hypothetical protein